MAKEDVRKPGGGGLGKWGEETLPGLVSGGDRDSVMTKERLGQLESQKNHSEQAGGRQGQGHCSRCPTTFRSLTAVSP